MFKKNFILGLSLHDDRQRTDTWLDDWTSRVEATGNRAVCPELFQRNRAPDER
jgi:hypothetical protein